MKNDQQEAFERVLTTSLARVLEFLKFAETKNAALLTFASAWILASVNLLNTTNMLPDEWRMSIAAALPLFALAALLALFSFLPRMALQRFHRDPEQTKALLYFGDAADFSPAAYRDRIRERYYPPDETSATRNYLDDLSIQIAVNSQITRRKLKLFHAGAIAILIAIVIVVTPTFVLLWKLAHPAVGATSCP